MYLSRLDLFGFKSFAHRTHLDFSDGLTCVIGPNGSGKSNIVDAIRWVLGEQRVTSLRSDKMENVIFNGNKSRKPMGFAEVAMKIENNRKILKTEYDEVVISRRLYRSGESQYFINKAPVRLKDVLDLFMDTGMGANSYSVIELKMVESILSDVKHERRLLFEEAAGVVKYKNRRRSALRKLEATRGDLTRLNDIISEIEKTVNSLSRQVSKAKRYLNYTEDLKRNETDLACYRYHSLIETVRPLVKQLEELKDKKDVSHRQITIDEALIEEYKNELIAKEQELRAVQDELQEIDTNISLIKQESAVSETKSEELIKTKERYRQEIESYRHKILLQESTIEEYGQQITLHDQEVDEIRRKFDDLNTAYNKKSVILSKEKEEIDALNRVFRDKLEKVTQQKEILKQNEFRLKLLHEDLEELRTAIQTLDQQIKTNSERLEKHRRQKRMLSEELTGLQDVFTQLDAQNEEYQQQRKTLENAYQKLVAAFETAKSRYNFYKNLISSYEGHSKSTQFIMASRNNYHGLFGPVSDIITAKEHIAQLVEIVLGNIVNFIVVDDITTAKQIIADVKTGNKGRVTCIPIEQVNQIPFTPPDRQGYNIPFLIDAIQFEKKYDPLIQILLGDVVLVDSLEEGLGLSKMYPHLRFISKNGERIDFNREVSGGVFEKRTAALVGRQNQLEKYAAELQRIEGELSENQKNLQKVQQQIEENEGHRRQTQEKIDSNRQSHLELDKEIGQIQYETNKSSLEKESNLKELSDIEASIEKNSLETGQKEKEVETLEASLDDSERALIHRNKQYDEESGNLRMDQEEVQKIQISLTNKENQLQNRKNDLERAQKNIQEYQQICINRETEINNIEQELVRLKHATQNRESDKIQIWEKRDLIEKQKVELDQHYQSIKVKIQNVEDEIKKYRREHDSSLELTKSLELQISENKLKAEGIREQFLKEYAEDVEVIIPYENFNIEDTEAKIEQLKNRIKNLGPVNPLAVSEHKKESERHAFLTKQRDDLLNAEGSLLETISKINKTARTNFTETFEKIRENFEKVFRNFFEQGEGTLRLVENEDPLEADIEINVRTKGRRLQTLSLLSGGEKTLTAISLLFAIYLVKPSPFCILDEVDAPLDDINITRFTEALKQFSNNTQFIIVTHNKRTMESAQTMYGVTMEEEGVSKLVSVKFN